MVVVQLAGFRRKAEVHGRRQLDGDVGGWLDGEAARPRIFRLVLQVEGERLILEIGQTGFGWERSPTEASSLEKSLVVSIPHMSRHKKKTYRAAGHLIGLAIALLVVHSASVTHHGHHKRESSRGPSVLIRIEENPETLKLVRGSENRSGLSTLLCEPHREAISEKVPFAVDLKLELDLWICVSNAHAVLHGKGQASLRTCQFVAVKGTREYSQPL